MAELQRDPITRTDFLGFGVMGAIAGAILTIPPVAFLLSPVIKIDVLGQSDVAQGWFKVASIREVVEGEPTVFEVGFPTQQTYGDKGAQEKFADDQKSNMDYETLNAIWLSWHAESGHPEDSKPPEFVASMREGDQLTFEQASEATEKLNVLSNSCAHLGCPVRWLINTDGEGEFLCPCHGGIYDINGDYIAGPPPRGMYTYTKEVRQDGNLYVRHEFDSPGNPYVI